jgi:hypothetical protein
MVKCGIGTRKAEGEREYFNAIYHRRTTAVVEISSLVGKVGSEGRPVLFNACRLAGHTKTRGTGASLGSLKVFNLADSRHRPG